MLAAVAQTKNIGGAIYASGAGTSGSDVGDGGARALLANACVTGFLGSLFTLPMYALNVTGGHLMFPNEVCKGVAVINQMLLLSLLTSSSAIAVHQCLILVTHSKGRYTLIQTRVILATSWLFPAAVAGACIPYVGFNERLLNCLFIAGVGHPGWVPISLIGVPVVVTLAVTGLCYILIYRAAAAARVTAAVGFMPSSREAALEAMVVSTVEALTSTSSAPKQQQQQHEGLSAVQRPVQVPTVQQTNGRIPEKSETEQKSKTSGQIREGYTVNQTNKYYTNVKKQPVRANPLKSGFCGGREIQLATKLTINWMVYAVIWTPLTVLYMSNETHRFSADLWLICSVLARLFCGVGWAVHGMWNKRLRMAIRKLLGINS